MERLEPMVAIDVSSQAAVRTLFDQLAVVTPAPIVKIGMELYYAYGPEIVRAAQARHLAVFLDLKLYDIPNTVQRTMTILGQLGVAFVTTHAAGGTAMLKAARAGLAAGAKTAGRPRPRLLAITQLTSIDQQILNTEQGVPGTVAASVQNYARLAAAAGLDGVVCSAHEVAAIRAVTGPTFLCITPGIRLSWNQAGDQKRVVTPAQARQLGSNAIVVGRPITTAAKPVTVYETIRQAFMED